MKRWSVLFLPVLMAVTCLALFGQAPQGGAPGAGGGGQGRGGGGGRGGGRGGAAAAPATGPIADWVAKMTEALNKGDAAAMNAMLTADAVWVDEDGHFPPASAWVGRLTTTGSKTLTVLAAPTPLRVTESGDIAWASFNFSLKETVTPRGQATGTPNEMQGIASIVLKKDGGEWKAFLIHAAAKGSAIQTH
jgi:ketosteroid isomerase-like protein